MWYTGVLQMPLGVSGAMNCPCCSEMVPCCSEDGIMLLRGWSSGWSPSHSQTIIKCDNAAAVRCSGALYADCRRASIAREARSTAPSAPRPRSGLGTRLFNFVTGARFYQ